MTHTGDPRAIDRRRIALFVALIAALCVVWQSAPWSTAHAYAATGDIGYAGQSTDGTGDAATGEKPESRLWWNDGSWWSILFDATSGTHHIFRLDRATERWLDTGTVVDTRAKSRSDVLWTGAVLYVASHVRAASATNATYGYPAYLYSYTYSAATGTYQIRSGFPSKINNYSSETLTLSRDSTGMLWASWAQGTKLYVNNTIGGDTTWGKAFVPAVMGATGMSGDDISSIVAFRNRIGIMWSSQTGNAMYFAIHRDGTSPSAWEPSRKALDGLKYADDHINLKSLDADPSGRVFAVVKTGLDEDTTAPKTAPQILVLARDPSTGDWTNATFGRISDCHTRPILMLDSEHQRLYVLATAPNSGCAYSGAPGTIFMKTSPMSALSFAEGRGTPVIKDVLSPKLNNATGAKQSINSATGLVVLASNDVTKKYWHADLAVS